MQIHFKFLRLSIFTLLIIISISLQGQILLAKVNKNRKKGGDPCQICNEPDIWLPNLIIEFKPNKFPFSINNVSLINASSIFPNSNIGGSQPFGGANSTCNNFVFSNVKILSNGLIHPNQTIFANSQLLDPQGNITIGISMKANLCTNDRPNSNVELCSSYKVVLEKTDYNSLDQTTHIENLFGVLNNLDYEFECIYNKSTQQVLRNGFKNLVPSNKILQDNNIEETSIVKIYPNPCSRILNLTIKGTMNLNSTFHLFDLSGKEHRLLPQRFTFLNKDNVLIDVSFLPKGPYLLKKYSGQKIEVVKFLKN